MVGNGCFAFKDRNKSQWNFQKRNSSEDFPKRLDFSKDLPRRELRMVTSSYRVFVRLLPICHQHSGTVIFIRFTQSCWPINHTGLDFLYPLRSSFIIGSRIDSIGQLGEIYLQAFEGYWFLLKFCLKTRLEKIFEKKSCWTLFGYNKIHCRFLETLWISMKKLLKRNRSCYEMLMPDEL